MWSMKRDCGSESTRAIQYDSSRSHCLYSRCGRCKYHSCTLQCTKDDLLVNDSAHHKILRALHEKHRTNRPFAIWEIRDQAAVSSSSVIRTLRELIQLKVVFH